MSTLTTIDIKFCFFFKEQGGALPHSPFHSKVNDYSKMRLSFPAIFLFVFLTDENKIFCVVKIHINYFN